MPASRCGFKTKLLCSTPRRKRLRPMGSMTGSTFATKDYGAVNLHRSAFISAIPRRSTDHPDSGYGSATEGCVDSLNGAASLEWPTPRTPGTPRSRAYALTCCRSPKIDRIVFRAARHTQPVNQVRRSAVHRIDPPASNDVGNQTNGRRHRTRGLRGQDSSSRNQPANCATKISSQPRLVASPSKVLPARSRTCGQNALIADACCAACRQPTVDGARGSPGRGLDGLW